MRSIRWKTREVYTAAVRLRRAPCASFRALTAAIQPDEPGLLASASLHGWDRFATLASLRSNDEHCRFAPARGPTEVEVQTMGIGNGRCRERPRERLLAHGAAVLSDAELLALIVRTGVAGKSALDIARDAIARFGGLPAFSPRRSPNCPLCADSARHAAAVLASVVELARRVAGRRGGHLRCARLAAGGPRLPAALARRPSLRSVHRVVPRQPEPRARVRGTLSRHAGADQRLSARGRQGSACAATLRR